jgi:protein-S-isoprenylcysteine O-methyltransferase Ste14
LGQRSLSAAHRRCYATTVARPTSSGPRHWSLFFRPSWHGLDAIGFAAPGAPVPAADYRLSPEAREHAGWVGTGLLAAALWLFWRSHHDLGANWSPSLEIGEQHALVTRGVYRHIRHPMYASQVLWSLAQMLLLPNWVAGWGGLVSFLPLYLSRIPNEERMMLDHFGEAYREYCARTGRILPRLGG